MIGETIGAYTIISELGRGGMGVVYLAQHRHLGRKAAIKFLMRELSEHPELLRRFFTEARAASLIEHDGIVRVFDCDLHQSGNAYIVMEYLEGQNLQQFLTTHGRLPYQEVAALVLRMADALAAAHTKGIIHRDLKPENIFILAGPPGGLKIVDFGLAKLTIAAQDAAARTVAGTLVGTPRYMSPEQAKGTTVDARADVYSLGCILYEMLAGRPPFPYNTTGELLAAHVAQTPPPLDPSLPISLRVLVEGMLAKLPEERPSLREEVIPLLKTVATTAPVATASIARPRPVPSPRPQVEGMGAESAALTRVRDTPHLPPRRRGARLVVLTGLVAVASAVAAVVWRPWENPRVRAMLPVAVERPQAPAQDPLPLPSATAPSAAVPEPAPSEAPVAEAGSEAGDAVTGKGKNAKSATARARARRGGKGNARQRKSTPATRDVAAAVAPTGSYGRFTLLSDPPGAYICVPGQPKRLGFTDETVDLRSPTDKTTFLLYRSGYQPERVVVDAAEQNGSRMVKLRKLGEGEPAGSAPCR